jgi:hypothetical protein
VKCGSAVSFFCSRGWPPCDQGIVSNETTNGSAFIAEFFALGAESLYTEHMPSMSVSEASGAGGAAPEPGEVDGGLNESPVNYDEEGLLEVELDERLYRFDAGKQGTALCLSVREPGRWAWRFLGELRWDGRDLRSKLLERSLLTQLSLALREFAAAE